MPTHIPVLPQETLEYLKIKKGGLYIDATIGEGGHSKEILKRLDNTGYLIGIDANEDIFTFTKRNLDEYKNYELVHSNFRNIKDAAQPFLKKYNHEGVDGILLDIGYSSWLLEKSERGFSHQSEEPLDMRFDIESGDPAYVLLSRMTLKDIGSMLEVGGIESYKLREQLAHTLYKNSKNIQTTGGLVSAIDESSHHDRASKKVISIVFQSLRISVNDEFTALQIAIRDSIGLLNNDGRLVVVAFHSGEDRIVKKIFREHAHAKKVMLLTKKPVKASKSEYRINPRSRSALLRACEKIDHV